jgi:hypothetical protein
MLGGAVWACGNVWVVPIVATLGLAKGILIWGMVNMLMGWASGRFGLFGLTPDAISDPTLNTVGVLFAIAALGVYVFVKSDAGSSATSSSTDKAASGDIEDEHDAAYAGLLYKETDLGLTSGKGGINDAGADGEEGSGGSGGGKSGMWTDKLTPKQKQIFGLSASVVSGLFYGVNFDPPAYVVDHLDKFPGASSDLSAYIFPHFCGIFITSILFLQGYAVVMGNNPKVFPKVIFPGFISGLMWATAQICWFQANSRLELTIAFPIISIGPGLVGALWGVFVFGEIKGKMNYIYLTIAFILTAASATCTVLSKN